MSKSKPAPANKKVAPETIVPEINKPTSETIVPEINESTSETTVPEINKPTSEETENIEPTSETIVPETTEDTVAKNEFDQANESEWIAAKLSPYFDAYPKEKKFHITTDGQVFLSNAEGFAKEHQYGLDKEKSIITFTVE